MKSSEVKVFWFIAIKRQKTTLIWFYPNHQVFLCSLAHLHTWNHWLCTMFNSFSPSLDLSLSLFFSQSFVLSHTFSLRFKLKNDIATVLPFSNNSVQNSVFLPLSCRLMSMYSRIFMDLNKLLPQFWRVSVWFLFLL